MSFSIGNAAGPFIIEVLTVDEYGNRSTAFQNPLREGYNVGVANPYLLAGYVITPIVSNAATPNLSLGLNFETLMNQATQITIDNPINFISQLVGKTINIAVLNDSTPNRPSPLFGSQFIGAPTNTDGTANTYSNWTFTVRQDAMGNITYLNTGFVTGKPI